MPEPLTDLNRLSRPAAGPILVVERHDPERRETPFHSHAQGQLLGSADGLISVATPQGWFVIPATHAIWLPPRCAHAFRSHGAFVGWAIYVAEDACGALPLRPRTVRTNALLRAAVGRAAGWNGPPRAADETRLAEVILDEVAGLPEEPLGLPMPRDGRLRRIADTLLADLSDQRGQQAWADWAAIPARTLSRRFVAETGFNFTAWRQRARALCAIERLAHGDAVTTVALDLGYDNVSAFIAMFRRMLGVTPGRYMEAIIASATPSGHRPATGSPASSADRRSRGAS